MKSFVFFALGALAFASTAAAQPTAADIAKGKTLVAQRCLACHSIVPGQAKPMGPNLSGLIGRKAGSGPGYKYSKAMTASPTVWTAVTLDKFLANPLGAMPGTAMVIGTPNAEERANIIAYLSAPQP
jgi:cytochrome c